MTPRFRLMQPNQRTTKGGEGLQCYTLILTRESFIKYQTQRELKERKKRCVMNLACFAYTAGVTAATAAASVLSVSLCQFATMGKQKEKQPPSPQQQQQQGPKTTRINKSVLPPAQ
jgi:hypothetical protein